MNSKLLKFVLFAIFLQFDFADSCQEGFTDVNIICASLDVWDVTSVGFGLAYRCSKNGGYDLITVPNTEISKVVHANGSAVTTVNAIEALNLQLFKINFFPRNLKNKMKKLKMLFFYQVELLSVSKRDLEQFGASLEYINLYGNRLTFLEGDLFEFNTKIRQIMLNANPIRFIDAQFFENIKDLKSLKVVQLNSVGCMSQSSSNKDLSIFRWNNTECFVKEIAKAETLLREVIGLHEHSLNNESCMKMKLDNSVK